MEYRTQNNNLKQIWNLAVVYLKKGKRKNFVLHTKEVIRAIKTLIKNEGGDKNILLPAVILHDVGWAKVPVKLQKSKNKKEKEKAMRLHIEYAPDIIKEILKKLNYTKKQINEITEIVCAHKFKNPKNKNKRLLIDADTLAEGFREQFWDDVKSYKCSPIDNYNWRIKNKFYTKTAKILFDNEMSKREKEIKKSKTKWEKEYSFRDFSNITFSTKNKNLSKKIDEIVYK